MGGFFGAVKTALFGNDSSEPQTKAIFTNNVSAVNNFLDSISQSVSMSIESDMQMSNSAKIGDRKIVATVGKGASAKIGTEISQTAEATNTQAITAVISEIIQSDVSADLKLDALANVMQNSESSKMFTEAKAGVTENNNDLSITNNVQTVKNLSTFLNVISNAQVKNNVEIGNLTLNLKMGEDSDFELMDDIDQQATYYNNQLIDLVNNSQTLKELNVSESLASDLKAQQTSKQTGTVQAIGDGVAKTTDSIGNGIAKTAEAIGDGVAKTTDNLTKPITYAIVGAIILIVMVGLALIFGGRRGGSINRERYYGGRYSKIGKCGRRFYY